MVRSLYKKLVSLYSRGFREQLGESIEQTFNDIYQEERRERTRSGLLLWMFLETAIGITREHVLLLIEGNAMKNMLLTVRSPALISLLLVVPFMMMEIVNRRGFNEGFPIPLLLMLWLLPVIFILIGMPMVRTIRAGGNLMVQPVNLVLRIVTLVLVAWLWTSLLIDQLPCFLGIPNCD